MNEKPISKVRSPAYSKTYATNVLLSETDSDVRLYGFNEIIKTDEGEELAVSDGEMILTKEAAVILFEQLEHLTSKWEKSFGVPVVSETRKSVSKRLQGL